MNSPPHPTPTHPRPFRLPPLGTRVVSFQAMPIRPSPSVDGFPEVPTYLVFDCLPGGKSPTSPVQSFSRPSHHHHHHHHPEHTQETLHQCLPPPAPPRARARACRFFCVHSCSHEEVLGARWRDGSTKPSGGQACQAVSYLQASRWSGEALRAKRLQEEVRGNFGVSAHVDGGGGRIFISCDHR